MTARVYKHLNNQGLYVFSLEGNFSSEKELNQLEECVSKTLETPDLKGLVISQEEEDLRINSRGLTQIIFLLSKLDDRSKVENKPKISFSNVKGKLKRLLEISKLDKKYTQYSSLEEAISSYQ